MAMDRDHLPCLHIGPYANALQPVRGLVHSYNIIIFIEKSQFDVTCYPWAWRQLPLNMEPVHAYRRALFR